MRLPFDNHHFIGPYFGSGVGRGFGRDFILRDHALLNIPYMLLI